MKNLRLGTLIVGALLIGGTMFVSSTFAGTGSTGSLTVVRHNPQAKAYKKVAQHAAQMRSQGVVDSKVVLVAPPSELPKAASAKMVTSTRAFAPTAPVAVKTTRTVAKAADRTEATARVTEKPTIASKVVAAPAPAKKATPQNLFTLVRLLNYSPHPLNEDLLRQSPLTLNGKNYWFSVKYDEDWNVITDEEAYMKGISFEIEVMEDNNKVRSLKTPKVAINPKKIKKGQILGVAEVAPYKFTISVEEFTRSKKGISELVFKLDLVG